MVPQITEVMTALGMAGTKTFCHVEDMMMLTSMQTICVVLAEVALTSL